MPPGFDRLKSFGHDELTAKHCYFRCLRPPDVDGIKVFDKDDQAVKHHDQNFQACFKTGGIGRPFDFISFSARPV